MKAGNLRRRPTGSTAIPASVRCMSASMIICNDTMRWRSAYLLQKPAGARLPRARCPPCGNHALAGLVDPRRICGGASRNPRLSANG
jgi:hypothetical protein